MSSGACGYPRVEAGAVKVSSLDWARNGALSLKSIWMCNALDNALARGGAAAGHLEREALTVSSGPIDGSAGCGTS